MECEYCGHDEKHHDHGTGVCGVTDCDCMQFVAEDDDDADDDSSEDDDDSGLDPDTDI